MKRNLLILTFALIILITGCSKQEPVSLEYKTTDGDPPSYKITMENKAEVDGDGKRAEDAEKLAERLGIFLDMTATIKTIKAEKGNLLHEVVIKSGKVRESASGEEEKIDEGEDFDMTIKKNGEVVKPFNDIPGLSPSVILPDEPVLPGVTWTESFVFSPAERIEDLELEGNFTLEKIADVKGLKCAVIKFEVPETAIHRNKIKGVFSSVGSMTFAYEKGMIVDFSVERNMKIDDPRPKSDVKIHFHQILSIEMVQ